MYRERLQRSLGRVNVRDLVRQFNTDKPLDAVAWLKARYKPFKDDISEVFRDMHLEAGWLGIATARGFTDAARERVKATVALDVTGRIDWDGWTPGNPALVETFLGEGRYDYPNFEAFLERAGVTIRGVEETRLNDLGGILARSAEAGLSMDATASMIQSEFFANGAWAETVARTEIRRASTESALGYYGEAGIEQKEWLVAWDEACEICQEAADMGPIPLDADFGEAGDGPPGHPNCLCVILPVIAEPEAEPEGDLSEGETVEPDSEPVIDEPVIEPETVTPATKDYYRVDKENWKDDPVAVAYVQKTYASLNPEVREIFADRLFRSHTVYLDETNSYAVVLKDSLRLENKYAEKMGQEIQTALAELPPSRRNDENGEPRFFRFEVRGKATGDTLAYTYLGYDGIEISPTAVRLLDAKRDETFTEPYRTSGHFMPAQQENNSFGYVVRHELGHSTDSKAQEPEREKLFAEWRQDFSKYGTTNSKEAYAEIFAEWTYGNPRGLPVVDAYAKEFGWER